MSSAASLQPAQVQAFWRYMQSHFCSTAVSQQDVAEVRVVRRLLRLLRVKNLDRFLERFTVTIGRRIYVPFTIGVAENGWDRWDQIEACVHEHQHIVQQDAQPLGFKLSYLCNRAARARYEAEAYRCNLELHFWRYGVVPPTRPFAEKLFEYGCRQTDVDVAARSLALSAVSIRQGAITNVATHVALEWLNEHLPELRAQGQD